MIGGVTGRRAVKRAVVAGTDTTKITTTAIRKGDRYLVSGQKVWISRVQHSDLMILLARTTPLAEVKRKSDGLSVFIVELKDAIGKGMTVKPIANMVNHETNELFFENLEIPEDMLLLPPSVSVPKFSIACTSPNTPLWNVRFFNVTFALPNTWKNGEALPPSNVMRPPPSIVVALPISL